MVLGVLIFNSLEHTYYCTSLGTFEKMMADKKIPEEKREEIRLECASVRMFALFQRFFYSILFGNARLYSSCTEKCRSFFSELPSLVS